MDTTTIAAIAAAIAAGVAAFAACLQAAAAFALLRTTAEYVRLTRTISDANIASTETSRATVDEMRLQRLQASQPLVVGKVKIEPPMLPDGLGGRIPGGEWKIPAGLQVELENVGNGPALKVATNATFSGEVFEAGHLKGPIPYIPAGGHDQDSLTSRDHQPVPFLPDASPFRLQITYEDIYHQQFTVTSVYSLARDQGATLAAVETAINITGAGGIESAGKVGNPTVTVSAPIRSRWWRPRLFG
jgi:hypothetical protein